MTVKVGINGFGRIGRNFFRALPEGGGAPRGGGDTVGPRAGGARLRKPAGSYRMRP